MLRVTAEWPGLLLRRPGADTGELKSRDLLRRFWNSAAGFWGQYGTPVSWSLCSGSTDAADEGGYHVQTRCNESAAHAGRGLQTLRAPWSIDWWASCSYSGPVLRPGRSRSASSGAPTRT